MKAKDKPDYIPQQNDLFADRQPVSLAQHREQAIRSSADPAAPIVPEYLHSVLCQVSLPRNATSARSFERSSGRVSIKIKAGELWDGTQWVEHPLPFGTKPRLVLIHVCSEAIRTKSREVKVGDTVKEFLQQLGINQATGGKSGSYTHFRRQMLALAACEMLLGYPTHDGVATVKAPPISQFEAWLKPAEGQAVMWPGVMTLSQEFYDALRDHAVPLDPHAITKLHDSSMQLDIYAWLAHRLCRVRQPAGNLVYWANLREQFGQEYADPRNFRRKFLAALEEVVKYYPDARIELVRGGLLLKPSKPPVPKTMTIVDHHRKLIDRGMG